MKPLWKHQTVAIERAKGLNEFGLFFEQGCGKSRTLIEILRYCYNTTRRVQRTLIVSPLITLENWQREISEFSKISEAKVAVLYGSGAKRIKDFLRTEEHNPNGFITIVNYEALLIGKLFAELKRWCPELLILDESHKCKNSKTRRTKRALELSHLADRRYILTGTPVLNNPMDIFSQYLILDHGETFGKNFFAFRAKYFNDLNAGMPRQSYFPNWQVRSGALEEINALIYNKAMRVLKKDCLDLPPLVRQCVYIDLTPEQRVAYEQMKKEFITFLQDKAIVARLAITKGLRLQQMATGFVTDEGGGIVRFESNPRLKTLAELLSNLTPDHKVIVWAVFRENYEQIKKVCEDLSIGSVEVHGGVSNRQKFENVDRFNDDPDVRVLIGNPVACGIGINLTASDYSIYYSRNFSLEADLQSEARNHRGGSEIHQCITRIDLIARDTIDEHVQKMLANKLEVSDKVLAQIAEDL